MREIKFRAWDKDDGVMRSWEELILDKEQGEDFYLLGYKENNAITSFDHEQILEQYMEINDENGKEIYEGDIVVFEDTGEEGYEYEEGFEYINQATVVFNNLRWELDNFTNDNSGVLEEMNSCHDDFISIFKHCKVIGNIHEGVQG